MTLGELSLPVLGGLMGLATFGAMLGARLLRERVWSARTIDALAVGVLLALVVDLAPRLAGSAQVILGSLVRTLPSTEWRRELTLVGPSLVQNLIVALLFVAYVASLKWGQGRRLGQVASAWRFGGFALGLAAYDFARGLSTAFHGSWLSAPLTVNLVVGLLLVQTSRGIALAGGLGTRAVRGGWLCAASLANGPPGLLGAGMGRQLAFETASLLLLPLFTLAGLGLALLLGQLLARGTEPQQQLPLGAFLIGFVLAFGSLRLVDAGTL